MQTPQLNLPLTWNKTKGRVKQTTEAELVTLLALLIKQSIIKQDKQCKKK